MRRKTVYYVLLIVMVGAFIVTLVGYTSERTDGERADGFSVSERMIGMSKQGGDTPKGVAESLAQQLAVSPGIPVLETALGDVVSDGVFDLRDVLRIRDLVLGMPPSGDEMTEADLNQDGFVNGADLDLATGALMEEKGIPHLIGESGGEVAGGGVTMTFDPGDVGGDVVLRVDSWTEQDVEDFSGVDFQELEADSTYFMTGFKLESTGEEYVYPPQMEIKLGELPACELQGSNLLMTARRGPSGTTELVFLAELEAAGDSTLLSPPPPYPVISSIQEFGGAMAAGAVPQLEPMQLMEIRGDRLSQSLLGNVVHFSQDGLEWYPMSPVERILNEDSTAVAGNVVPVAPLPPGLTTVRLEHAGKLLISQELQIEIVPTHIPTEPADTVIVHAFAAMDTFLAEMPFYGPFNEPPLKKHQRAYDLMAAMAPRAQATRDHILSSTETYKDYYAAILENLDIQANLDDAISAIRNDLDDQVKTVLEAGRVFLQLDTPGLYADLPVSSTEALRAPRRPGLQLDAEMGDTQPDVCQENRPWDNVSTNSDLGELPPVYAPAYVGRWDKSDRQGKSDWGQWNHASQSRYLNGRHGAGATASATASGFGQSPQSDPSFDPRDYPGFCMNIWKHNTNAAGHTGGGPPPPPDAPCANGGSAQALILVSNDGLVVDRAASAISRPEWAGYLESPLKGAIVTPLNGGIPGIVGIIDGSGAFAIPGLAPGEEIHFSIYDPKSGYYDPDAGHAVAPNIAEQGAWFSVFLYFDPPDETVTLPMDLLETVVDSIVTGRPRVEYVVYVGPENVGQEFNITFGSNEPLTFWIQDPFGHFVHRDSMQVCHHEEVVTFGTTGSYKLTVTYGATGGSGPFEIAVTHESFPISYLGGTLRGVLPWRATPYFVCQDVTIPDGDSLIIEPGVAFNVVPGVTMFNYGTIDVPSGRFEIPNGLIYSQGPNGSLASNGGSLPNFVILPGGTATHVRGQLSGVHLTVDSLEIQTGGRVCASEKGYRGTGRDGWTGTRGEAPSGVEGSYYGAGGSHGGYGAKWVANAGSDVGDVYGAIDGPVNLGAGGSHTGISSGGNGGGLIRIVANRLVLNGEMLANGQTITANLGSGGAGGAIDLDVGEISGSGKVYANGGTSGPYAGGGGGGRVAIRWQEGSVGELDIRARGGNGNYGAGHGGAGTIYLLGPEAPDGTLIVDNGGVNGASTPLMSGRTSFVRVTVSGAGGVTVGALQDSLVVTDSLLVTGTASYCTFANNAFFSTPLVYVGTNGTTTLGQTMGLDVDRVKVVGGTFSTSTSMVFGQATDLMLMGGLFQVFKTATVTLPQFEAFNISLGTFRNWGTVEVQSDSIVVGTGVTLEESGMLTSDDRVSQIRVYGTLSHARYELALSGTSDPLGGLNVTADSMVVESGGAIDVSLKGYRGGNSDGNPAGGTGETKAGVTPSTRAAGGSYGGRGGNGTEGGGASNPVYGDPQNPVDFGSGGASNRSGTRNAGNGGGLVMVDVEKLVVNGSILSNGGNGVGNAGDGGGSGGGINIRATTLQGTGVIRANGGAGNGYAGGGGGGRIAIRYDDAPGFSFDNVIAQGGPDAHNGGAGTVYFEGPLHGTKGTLVVDNVDRWGQYFTPLTGATTEYSKMEIRRRGYLRIGEFVSTLSVEDSIRMSSNGRLMMNDGTTLTTPKLVANLSTIYFGSGMTVGVTEIKLENQTGMTTGTDLTFAQSDDFLLSGGSAFNNELGVTFTIDAFTPSNIVSGTFRNFGMLEIGSDSLVIGSGVTLEESGMLTSDDRVSQIRIYGTLSHARYELALSGASDPLGGLELAADSMVVENGGAINVSYGGYRGGHSDGKIGGEGETKAGVTPSTRAAGGSYGGRGGNGTEGGGVSNPVYGDPQNPVDFGSGGASNRSGTRNAGNGGGLVMVDVEKLVVNGSILSNGGNGVGNAGDGGGSGGGINIRATTLQGTGVIRANGGAGNTNGGGGGGGRIAIFTNSDISSISVLASGGSGYPVGQSGTVIVDNLTAYLYGRR